MLARKKKVLTMPADQDHPVTKMKVAMESLDKVIQDTRATRSKAQRIISVAQEIAEPAK